MRQKPWLSSLFIKVTVHHFFICLPIVIYASLSVANNQCENLFESNSVILINEQRIRGIPEIRVDWNNDISYMEANQKLEALGVVDTFFSKTFDTQIYYTKTGIPNKNNEVPLIDPQSKAVFIFFHGSGTMKSSGRNFISNMNTLAKLGYSAISADMPHHAEGPVHDKFNNAFYYMEWIKQIVIEAKKSGKPVILAGHSFGPDVILEFATRYPKLIDGVVALSPAGFTKELEKWYYTYTTKMKFGGDVAENNSGGEWAARMSKQFLWSRKKLSDPTQINPNLKIRILSGNLEEYVPAPLHSETGLPVGINTYDVSIPLKSIFKNATITIEPGIGHYLFEHQDQNGYNVVLRELLATVGVTPDKTKSMIDALRGDNQNLVPSIQLAKKYSHDKIFKAWFDLNYKSILISKIFVQGIDSVAQKIITDYGFALKDRNNTIFQKILLTRETDPEFYEKYKNFIDKMNPKIVDTTLFPAYLQYLKEKSTRAS